MKLKKKIKKEIGKITWKVWIRIWTSFSNSMIEILCRWSECCYGTVAQSDTTLEFTT